MTFYSSCFVRVECNYPTKACTDFQDTIASSPFTLPHVKWGSPGLRRNVKGDIASSPETCQGSFRTPEESASTCSGVGRPEKACGIRFR